MQRSVLQGDVIIFVNSPAHSYGQLITFALHSLAATISGLIVIIIIIARPFPTRKYNKGPLIRTPGKHPTNSIQMRD
jgi:hypothetical protein